MRLDINYKKKTVRNTNTWRLNKTFLNNQQVTEKIKREIKKFLETWKWKHNSKPMRYSESSSKREVYSSTILPQETNKKNRLDNLTTLKTTGKRRRTTTTKLKISRINHKDPSRNKWKRNERNNNKD